MSLSEVPFSIAWIFLLRVYGWLQEFEALLKEVVLAKRLSASKMNNLTDIAVRNMEVRSIINVLQIVVLNHEFSMTHSWSQYCTELTSLCQLLLPKFQVCMFSMHSQGLQSIIPRSTVFLAMRLHIQATQPVSCSKLVALWRAYFKTWLPLGPSSRRSVVIYTFSCRTVMCSLSLALACDLVPRIYPN